MRAAGKLDIKAKGAAGELAALDIVHAYRAKHGGILKQGFTFPYASNRQGKTYLGNVFWDAEQGRYSDMTRDYLCDEIDILYISEYCVIPIEVKSYHDQDIVITDTWVTRKGVKVDKSPITQAEKHARHLYHQIYDVLPDGDPAYIKPIVCFVDSCVVDDTRCTEMREYLPVTVLNELNSALRELDVPMHYTLDLGWVERKLKNIERRCDM